MGASDQRKRYAIDLNFGAGQIIANTVTLAPTTWHFGLSTTAPNADGTGVTEPVGGAYARVAMTNNATNFPAAATVTGTTRKTNGVKITWPNPTGTWGVVTYWVAFQAPTGGTPDFWNPMDNSITVKSGNTPVEIDTGQLVIPVA